jgi:hypothetical protein
VDTLEYLAKGGRIGNAKAFLGTVLKVKPILFLRDGLIEPLEQVRSKRKAVNRMLDLAAEYVGDSAAQAKVVVAHALVPDEAQQFAGEVHARLGCAMPTVSDVGPVIEPIPARGSSAWRCTPDLPPLGTVQRAPAGRQLLRLQQTGAIQDGDTFAADVDQPAARKELRVWVVVSR